MVLNARVPPAYYKHLHYEVQCSTDTEADTITEQNPHLPGTTQPISGGFISALLYGLEFSDSLPES